MINLISERFVTILPICLKHSILYFPRLFVIDKWSSDNLLLALDSNKKCARSHLLVLDILLRKALELANAKKAGTL